MRYLIISDIHGSFDAIKKIENIINENEIDKIICLGDVLYHGPRNDLPKDYSPKKVVIALKKYLEKIIFIKGNCDAEVDEMVLERKFSKRKKINLFKKDFILTHGHHLSRFDIDETIKKGTIVLYGHYHVFDISIIDGVTYVNIGSTSIPKDGIPQYAIMDEKRIIVYNLDNGEIIGKLDF